MNDIQKARKACRDAFKKNEDFRRSYHANIAMKLYDEMHSRGYKPKLKPNDRNHIANEIIALIFDE